jgi:hypothetical protein
LAGIDERSGHGSGRARGGRARRLAQDAQQALSVQALCTRALTSQDDESEVVIAGVSGVSGILGTAPREDPGRALHRAPLAALEGDERRHRPYTWVIGEAPPSAAS